MSFYPKVRLTPEEYLASERQATYKSEYVHGERSFEGGLSPMAGGREPDAGLFTRDQ
jgi:hypothetical protein